MRTILIEGSGGGSDKNRNLPMETAPVLIRSFFLPGQKLLKLLSYAL